MAKPGVDFKIFHLAEATERGKLKELQAMLDGGADPNQKDFDRGMTPLHYAANKGNIEAIEILVDAGANVNVQNKRGRTPLHSLVELKYDKIVLWLIQYCSADPYILDSKNLSPMDLALNWFQKEILQAYEKRAQVQAGEEEEEESDEEDQAAIAAAQKAKQTSARTTVQVEAEIFKIYLPNGSYKSVKVSATDTADVVCETLADKLTLPRSFGKYFVMWERVKEREQKLQPGEQLFEMRKKWPLIFGNSGNETHSHCHFFITLVHTAPDKLKALVS